MSRILPFDAIDNFRDYGDYATAAGRRVKPGLLFRSAHHARATEPDLERLGQLTEAGPICSSQALALARQRGL